MAGDDLGSLEERLDRATTQLLLALRSNKHLNSAALGDLLIIAETIERMLSTEDTVPRQLVGKLWFVFTAMLAEADHAREPEPILDAAWQYQERLRRAFGPNFD